VNRELQDQSTPATARPRRGRSARTCPTRSLRLREASARSIRTTASPLYPPLYPPAGTAGPFPACTTRGGGGWTDRSGITRFRPAGRLAAPQHEHRAGRTADTVGIAVCHALTPTELRQILSPLRIANPRSSTRRGPPRSPFASPFCRPPSRRKLRLRGTEPWHPYVKALERYRTRALRVGSYEGTHAFVVTWPTWRWRWWAPPPWAGRGRSGVRPGTGRPRSERTSRRRARQPCGARRPCPARRRAGEPYRAIGA
jgi:hypothetical protein